MYLLYLCLRSRQALPKDWMFAREMMSQFQLATASDSDACGNLIARPPASSPYATRKEDMMKICRPKTSAEVKNIISRNELRDLIAQELDGKLEENFCLYMADIRYYLPPKENADAIIHGSKIREMTDSVDNVRGERFDCDDFALLLKARFSYAAYRDRTYPNFAYCFGIVWGLLPSPFGHSLNWYISADRELWFVEPQKHKSFKPRPADKCIYFMLV